jgi:hypothetical protein
MDAAGKRIMADFLAAMKDGEAVEFSTRGGDLILERLSFAELTPIIERPGTVGFIGDVYRPGVMFLTRFLELKHFTPGTPKNDLLRCFQLRWVSMLWSLTLFHVRSLGPGYMADALERAGLRFVAGVPMALAQDVDPLGPGNVPAGNPRAFADGWLEPDLPFDRLLFLENRPGHLVYRDPAAADRQQAAMILALEAEWEKSR